MSPQSGNNLLPQPAPLHQEQRVLDAGTLLLAPAAGGGYAGLLFPEAEYAPRQPVAAVRFTPHGPDFMTDLGLHGAVLPEVVIAAVRTDLAARASDLLRHMVFPARPPHFLSFDFLTLALSPVGLNGELRVRHTAGRTEAHFTRDGRTLLAWNPPELPDLSLPRVRSRLHLTAKDAYALTEVNAHFRAHAQGAVTPYSAALDAHRAYLMDASRLHRAAVAARLDLAREVLSDTTRHLLGPKDFLN